MLILASQSPARRRLLKRLGFKFKTLSPNVDEDAFKAKFKTPKTLVRVLAAEKARAVADRFPDAVVIGSDQMMVCRSRVFGKPRSIRGACEQLAFCSGKTIELLTAVTVRRGGVAESFVQTTKMKLRKLTKDEIEAYVKLDLPLECAGSFMFEKHGASLFESVTTDDPTGIEGLPILRLNSILRSRFRL